ncbi:hypothetical protein KZ686_14830 [Cupriavidus cauae]|uniref:hypothetical protein n=1 Tax=Cupriavidus TaxID=106589 RepID=UPI001CF20578|nr:MULTISPECIES: hypothetical protein [Cupriavidus]MCA7084318.1 hypothetical protein [Cupriavidus sp. DB3]UZN48984.1 hypothetical protein KZ686_14830 [Cupriavidus cauae]
MNQPSQSSRLRARGRPAALLAALLGAPLLAACISTTPIWDSRFGQSVNAVKQAQIINPNAPAGLPSLTGVDGRAAVAAMGNYDRSLQRLSPAGAYGNGAGMQGGIGMSGGIGTR